MKKITIITLLITFALAVNFIPATKSDSSGEINQCTDSDNGANLYSRGKVTLKNGRQVTDFCRDSNTLSEFTCSSNLDGWDVNYHECPNKCSRGACLMQSEEIAQCTDTDPSNDIFSKGIINASQYPNVPKKDYCNRSGDKVMEHNCRGSSTVTAGWRSCPNGCENGACKEQVEEIAQCTDTDPSNDIFSKGIINASQYPNVPKKDYCNRSGNKVMELNCRGGSFVTAGWKSCPNGCENGACKEQVEEIAQCTDTDPDNDIFKKGVINASQYPNVPKKDYCNRSGDKVMEHNCRGSSTVTAGWRSCPNGCENGACKEQVEEIAQCTDTDPDNDIFKKGVINASQYPNVPKKDYCNRSGNKVMELNCRGSSFVTAGWKSCPNGCENGACKESENEESDEEDDEYEELEELYEDELADLTISVSKIRYVRVRSRSTGATSKKYKVYLKIANQGEEDIDGSIYYSYQKQGGRKKAKRVTRRGLRAGKSIRKTLYLKRNNRRKLFTFTIDPNNQIEEINENNNQTSAKIKSTRKK